MCELRERKQSILDEACVAFANRHNVEQLAKQSAITGTMLRNKLNPSQPHQLTVTDLMVITEKSGDYSLTQSVLHNLNMVAAPIDLKNESRSLAERALVNAAFSGDLAKEALELNNTIRLPRSRRNQVMRTAQSALANLVLIVNELENRTGSTSPLLGFASDFVISGMPIPGLS